MGHMKRKSAIKHAQNEQILIILHIGSLHLYIL